MLREALERDHAVLGGHLADCVHAGVEVERGQPWSTLLDLGDARADLASDERDRITCHEITLHVTGTN